MLWSTFCTYVAFCVPSEQVTTRAVHEEATPLPPTSGAAHLSVDSYPIDCKAFANPKHGCAHEWVNLDLKSKS